MAWIPKGRWRGRGAALCRRLLLVLVALLALPPGPARPEVFETLTPANPLATPGDLAVDRFGNVYVLGSGSGNVFQVAPNGAVREVFDLYERGLGDWVAGLRGIAVDPAGAVYVTASETHNALRVFPEPVVEIIRASGDGLGNGLGTPTGIATDAGSRDVYVVGSGSDSVFKITAGGSVSQILDQRGDGLRSCLRPVGIVIDSRSNVSVACEGSNNVFRITPAGRIREVLADRPSVAPPVLRPRVLATDAAANVYVGTQSGIFRISPTGEQREIVARESGVSLGSVSDLAVDSAGNLYVSSPYRNRVYRMEPGGRLGEVANGSGDGTNPLDFPNGLAVDASDNLYVLGGRSHNAFRIAPDGSIVQILDAAGDRSWLHLRGLPLRRRPFLRR